MLPLLLYGRTQNKEKRGGDMPRAPSENVVTAEKMFRQGIPMVDIAKKLGVSDGTVRSWKNRYGWGNKAKKNQRNVAKKENGQNATLQKRKRGAQPHNQNAKGGRGNPHPVHKISPDAAVKHGGYRPVYMDALDDDERELVDMVPEDVEDMLLEQIQLFSIRERRILKAINKYLETKADVAVSDVSRYEEKRMFKNSEEEAEYDRRQELKVAANEKLPGKAYSLQTHTTNKDMIIARLEQELSVVQGKKTKAIEALYKIRMEREKQKQEEAASSAVDDWISAVIATDEKEAGIHE